MTEPTHVTDPVDTTDARPPLTAEERNLVLLEVDGPIAVITNNRPEKHNAMSDEMDRRLWEVLAEVHAMPGLRAIVWRGEGKSFSSGRDTGQIGVRVEDISDLEFIERGHRPTQMFLTMPCPIVCALKGWVIGGAFERALLCDLRVAAVGTRFMLPEVVHGVIPDSGGVSRLFQMAGHGVAADLALTGRVMSAEEAYGHGIVSRLVAPEELDETAMAIARTIAEAPAFTVKMARRTIASLANEEVQRSIAGEAVAQSMVFASSDYAEMKAGRAEGREPTYRRR
jgi:enoyl-CoA hydratase/carnithine racemase